MIFAKIYNLLEHPFVYRLSQILFAPGAEKGLTAIVQKIVKHHPLSGKILDVGCGPDSWLSKVGGKPFGLDVSYSYSVDFQKVGNPAITGSAMKLPFKSDSFSSVWSVGVLHHLPDEAAIQATVEMLRVCRVSGQVIILDAVLPITSWKRPLASLVRCLDRGRFMRAQKQIEAILPQERKWTFVRHTYSYNGLEILGCICKKES